MDRKTYFDSILNDTLAYEMSALVKRVQRSLVVVRVGKHGVGAGVIPRSDGLIVTNQHVAGSHSFFGRVRPVVSAGGWWREFAARALAHDPEIDLALLQIDDHDSPAAQIADSRLVRVGAAYPGGRSSRGQLGFGGRGSQRAEPGSDAAGPCGSVDIIRSARCRAWRQATLAALWLMPPEAYRDQYHDYGRRPGGGNPLSRGRTPLWKGALVI